MVRVVSKWFNWHIKGTDSPATFLLLSFCTVRKTFPSCLRPAALRLLRGLNSCSSSIVSLVSDKFAHNIDRGLCAGADIQMLRKLKLQLVSTLLFQSLPLPSCLSSSPSPSLPHTGTQHGQIIAEFWRNNLFSLMTNSQIFWFRTSAANPPLRSVAWTGSPFASALVCLSFPPPPRLLSINVFGFNVAWVYFFFFC